MKPFKLDHIQHILPVLGKGHWAAKIDLKDAYFHIPVSPGVYQAYASVPFREKDGQVGLPSVVGRTESTDQWHSLLDLSVRGCEAIYNEGAWVER